MNLNQQVPSHVPQDLVRITGHLYDQDFLADPYEFYARAHEIYPPIFYDPVSGGWVTIKHAVALRALRDTDHFCTGIISVFPREESNWYYMIPQEIEPPQHRKYRGIIDTMLSPVAVKQLSDDIRKLANELIDQVIEKGECEFTVDFARPLPVTVFLKFMGLPLEQRDQFVRWVVKIIETQGKNDESAPVMREIEAYLAGVIQEKRAIPDSGAISRIVNGQIDGRPLDEREVFGFVFFLFIAGIDTVYAAMNNIWHWLAENPDARQKMLDNPQDIDAQLEELLRKFGVTFSSRELTRDLELDGVLMKRGERILCMLPACNYDPDVFPSPRQVDFSRPRKPNLTFTGGIHACMGAHLARLEMRIALQEWLRRIPHFRVKSGTAITYPPSGVVGPNSVPLVW